MTVTLKTVINQQEYRTPQSRRGLLRKAPAVVLPVHAWRRGDNLLRKRGQSLMKPKDMSIVVPAMGAVGASREEVQGLPGDREAVKHAVTAA